MSPRRTAFALALFLVLLLVPAAIAQGPADAPADADPSADAATIANTIAPPSARPHLYDPTGISFIENLRARDYGGGEMQRVRVLDDNADFTRYLITYPSDDLVVQGFMDVPKNAEPPYAAIIVAHGYVNPDNYPVLPYSTPYADALARAGFLVVHPNYRNHGGSGRGPNPMRSGYAIDVLNLVEILKSEGDVRPGGIGIFGHSMGGEVALRALVTTTDIHAAVLYGSMSADSWQNWNLINNKWAGGWFLFDGPFNPWRDREAFRLSSPIAFLDDVQAPIQLHHGTADDTAPYGWATDLAQRLHDHGKDAELFTYPGAGHSFWTGSAAYNALMARSIAFFDARLRNGP